MTRHSWTGDTYLIHLKLDLIEAREQEDISTSSGTAITECVQNDPSITSLTCNTSLLDRPQSGFFTV